MKLPRQFSAGGRLFSRFFFLHASRPENVCRRTHRDNVILSLEQHTKYFLTLGSATMYISSY